MNDRYILLNQLYQMICFEQMGEKIPEEALKDKRYLKEIKQAIGEVAEKLCRINGGDVHQTQLAIAKLFTAGLVELERGKDGEVRLNGVEDIDYQFLQEFNDNLSK